MKPINQIIINKHKYTLAIVVFIYFSIVAEPAFSQIHIPDEANLPYTPSKISDINLSDIPYKILYETYRDTNGTSNWELFIMNADGSDKINLTKTPDFDEMYPHVSPDGTKISFVIDEGTNRRNKTRSVYYMNIDGTGRIKIADNAREPCWSPDGKKIAYLKGEYGTYNTREYATSEMMIYDLQKGLSKQHPNTNLEHIYAICWAPPDGKWFLGVTQGNTIYSDTILAIEADGMGVYDLAIWGVKGCRPDIRLDGKKVVWGDDDWDLCIGDIDFSQSMPQVTNIHTFVKCLHDYKVYHVELSPDGKYAAFSYGPFEGGQQVGGMAKGWNICVTDFSGKWVKITTDGNHNKEPDWVPIVKSDKPKNEVKDVFVKAK
jgi:Tol biopolymer transport system component